MQASINDDLMPVSRLTTAEVMALARVSRATLWRRIASGRLPHPVDHGRQALFNRAAVLDALRAPAPTAHAIATERRLAMLRRRRKESA